jgi:hypothetical protein
MSARFRVAGMASDVELVILTPNFAQLAANPNWFLHLRPGSQLIRATAWEDCSSAASGCAADCRSTASGTAGLG